MSWEFRGTNGPYYTRSKKVNGRVVREYVGRGRIGELSAAMDAEERHKREALVGADRRWISESDEAERSMAALCDSVDTLMRAVLCASGYRQHKHGEWRYRRGGKTQDRN